MPKQLTTPKTITIDQIRIVEAYINFKSKRINVRAVLGYEDASTKEIVPVSQKSISLIGNDVDAFIYDFFGDPGDANSLYSKIADYFYSLVEKEVL